MGLLRNASGLLIPSQTGGQPGRADDPEFHIRRLEHFGKGMGIDLASTHPHFSSKFLSTSSYGPTADQFEFDTHDEGLHLPWGHIDAASHDINEQLPTREYRNVYDDDENNRIMASDELIHRAPYSTVAKLDFKEHPGTMRGSTSKHAFSGKLDLNDEDEFAVTTLRHSWGDSLPSSETPAQLHPTYKDAFKQLSSDFGKFNRDRKGPKPEVNAIVTRAISNPNTNRLISLKRHSPGHFSSQFLKVFDSKATKEAYKIDSDVIDLKTGNWAKIDPEGYFPD